MVSQPSSYLYCHHVTVEHFGEGNLIYGYFGHLWSFGCDPRAYKAWVKKGLIEHGIRLILTNLPFIYHTYILCVMIFHRDIASTYASGIAELDPFAIAPFNNLTCAFYH